MNKELIEEIEQIPMLRAPSSDPVVVANILKKVNIQNFLIWYAIVMILKMLWMKRLKI